jgi:DNA-binding MarR family transcriptional regulator
MHKYFRSQSNCMELKTKRAIEARREQGAEADYDLYEKISDVPESSGYQLAKLMGWSTGRTNSAIARLEKKGLVKVERIIKGNRLQLSVTPRPWQEFFSAEELEEMRQPEYKEGLERIRKGES